MPRPLVLLALLLALLPAVPVRAQMPPAPTQSMQDLTADQQARYQKRIAQARKDYAALQNNKKLTDAQKQKEAAALAKKVDADTLSYLTPTQRDFVLKQRAARAAFGKAHAQQIKDVNALNLKLNKSLSPDQRAQIAAIFADNNTQIKKIADDPSLSNAQKQQQAAAVRSAADEKVRAVLSPAQQADQKRLQQMETDLQTQAAQSAR